MMMIMKVRYGCQVRYIIERILNEKKASEKLPTSSLELLHASRGSGVALLPDLCGFALPLLHHRRVLLAPPPADRKFS